jgi:hypothetical protein
MQYVDYNAYTGSIMAAQAKPFFLMSTVRSPQFYLPDGGVIFLVRFISHTLVELYLVGVINNDSSLVSSTTSSIECIDIR